MKTLPILLLLCSAISAAQAQIGPDACVYCSCLADGSCSNVDCNAASTNDCSSRVFSVPCGGTYYVRPELNCSNGTYCDDCCVYSKITGPNGTIVECHLPCIANDCKYECILNLNADVSYTWYVCFRICWQHQCSDCSGGNCVARVWLYKNRGDLCPLPCN